MNRHRSFQVAAENKSYSSNPTETSSIDISAHRARWSAHRLTKYAYDYKVTGFLISFAGHDIHLVVLDGVVRSATDLVTGQAAPGDPASWPTIDKLFDEQSREADPRKREAMLKRIQQRVVDQAYFAPIFQLQWPNGVSKTMKVSGMGLIPTFYYTGPFEEIELR